jgi:choline dehydrogenase-like flavoprotein
MLCREPRSLTNFLHKVCATLGEFDDKNKNNHVTLNKGTDPTCNINLQFTLSEEDYALWDVMDEATYNTIKAMSGGDAVASSIEYWDENAHGWKSARPPVDTIRIPGIVHEASTAYVGPREKGGSLDEWYRPHGVENVFVTGAALFPTAGSWNPTLTMCGYAQDLAHKLYLKQVSEDSKAQKYPCR